MSRNNDIHPYVHSPPTIELAPPHKKHRKPIPSASLPIISPPSPHKPTLPVSIPITSNSLTTSVDIMNSCPPLTTSRRASTSSPVLYSLPEFRVGSLPKQPPSVWPVAMVNDFLTPSSNRSLSLSDPSSDDSDDQPLIFKMDD